MNKLLITSILALLTPIGAARAEEQKVSVLDRQGGKASFEKSGVASINLHADKVEIVGKDGQTSSFNKGDIALILLSDTESGVRLTTDESTTISVKATKDAIHIKDAIPATPWRVIEMSGTILMSGRCGKDSCDIDITTLPAGAYLFTIADKTIRFIKR